MVGRFTDAIELARALGPRWVLWRAGYALRRRSGLLKRSFPAVNYNTVQLADLVDNGVPTSPDDYRVFRETGKSQFFFEPGRTPDSAILDRVISASAKARTVAVADDYCRGRFLFYSKHTHDLGRPVNWLLNPFTGAEHHTRTHWCDYPTFSATAGDIKDVWEPSRFACAFWVARAYALTGDDKYAEAFWELFESWCGQNPPNMGPNWKCGQETALRTMAWCFALYAFWSAPATTPDRIVALVKVLALQAERIANNIDYAVSQKNNHAISEAVGLLTTALLFPELKGAARWHAIGRSVLENEVRRQVYEDGSYVQHSMNYHRLMLHDCLWAIRLAALNDQPLSDELAAAVHRADEFLFQMVDPHTGRAPNCGANDGALVLPLNSCDYLDYRPVVQSCRYLANQEKAYPAGDRDEDLLWLFGPQTLQAPVSDQGRTSNESPVGGYYTLQGKDAWAMVRCQTYRDRVGHVDLLHLDLWAEGVNLLRDCGSYRYFVADGPELGGYLKSIEAHNTIVVDGKSPLRPVSRFTLLPWPKAELSHFRVSPERIDWQGSHFAYDRRFPGLVHTRRITVDVPRNRWDIADQVQGSGHHQLTLRWHLPPTAEMSRRDSNTVRLQLPCGWVIEVQASSTIDVEILESRADGGYESLYYGEIQPIRTLSVISRCQLPGAFGTVVWKEQPR